jgi:flagellar protein FliO/FliZ
MSFFIWLVAGSVLAESSTPLATSKDVSSFTNWPIILVVLIGMIGFIFSLGWFVRRFGGMSFSSNREMKVVTSIALGTKERIALIDIKGKQFLIGVTSQQISHLHSFDEAIITSGASDNPNTQSDFVSKLQSVLNSAKSNNSSGVASTKGSESNAS